MEEKKHCYEGMFLLDAGKGTFEVTVEPLQKILARSEVEVVMMKPWDELKLAYEIKDPKRGLYVLAYLKIDPEKIVEIEHDCQLSEDILRILLIRKDSISDENLSTETPAELAEVQAAEAQRVADAAAAEADAAAAEAAKAAEAAEATVADVDAPADEVAESLEDAAAVAHEDVVVEDDAVAVEQATPADEDAPDTQEEPAAE